MLSLIVRRSQRLFAQTQSASVCINLLRLLRMAARTATSATDNRRIGTELLPRVRGRLADWLMLGGVLVMPVAAAIAVVGAMTPPRTAFHQHIGDFFIFAAFWFVTALFAAQFQRRRADDSALD